MGYHRDTRVRLAQLARERLLKLRHVLHLWWVGLALAREAPAKQDCAGVEEKGEENRNPGADGGNLRGGVFASAGEDEVQIARP